MIPVLTGPTASGKSAVALRFAQRRPTWIVNADSKQVYAEIPVLTAQPTAEERARARHKLYGYVSVRESYTAARWVKDAAETVRQCLAEGAVPLLVGGTGFYIDALTHGLSPAPAPTEGTQKRLLSLVAEEGTERLHALLEAGDPESAARISPNDAPRLVRAYGTLLDTGVPLSAWNARPRVRPLGEKKFAVFSLERDRETLYRRCEARFDAMLANGALEEARLCMERSGGGGLLASAKAHGLPELIAHLQGRMTLEEAAFLAKRNTRRYVKRQFTWMRHQLPERIPLTSTDDGECAEAMERAMFSG
jgi:tRNA dimethylallyltransferase